MKKLVPFQNITIAILLMLFASFVPPAPALSVSQSLNPEDFFFNAFGRVVENVNHFARTKTTTDMRLAADRAGISIDVGSVRILSLNEGTFIDTLVTDFDQIGRRDPFLDGEVVAFIYVDFPMSLGGLSPGFYVQRITFDPLAFLAGKPDAGETTFENVNGEVFKLPSSFTVIPGSYPFTEKGPRSTLSIDVGEVTITRCWSCEDINLLALWCITTKVSF